VKTHRAGNYFDLVFLPGGEARGQEGGDGEEVLDHVSGWFKNNIEKLHQMESRTR
jgi:hypothetical protein